jgi:hypothetical protein
MDCTCLLWWTCVILYRVRIILLLIRSTTMRKLYKILDYDGSVVRIFGYKEEAERFLRLDKSFKIQVLGIERKRNAENKFNWAYKNLGDALL